MSVNKKAKRHFTGPTYCIGMLVLLLFLFQYSTAKQHHKTKRKSVEDTMTVAAIRIPNKNETFVRITFLRSQKFYKLSNDANPKYLGILKESEKEHTPVIISRARAESDVILSVRKP